MGKRNPMRQARLGFAPIDPSSPAAESQPDSVRHRAAAVTIADSPGVKRRRTLRDYAVTSDSSPLPHGGKESSGALVSPRPVTRAFMMSSQNGGKVTRQKEGPSNYLADYNDSESDEPVMQSSPSRKPKAPKAQKVDLTSSSEDDLPRSSRRRPSKPSAEKLSINSSQQEGNDDDDDDDDDELPVRRLRRSNVNSQSTPKKATKQDEADLDEDLDFLGHADTESPRALRRRDSAKKSAKQTALEALRKKRLKRDEQHVSDQPDGHEDEESENRSESDISYGDNLDDAVSEDFVVEDDGDQILGGPVELPFQFSQYRTMKPQQLFKFVVEWMVQKKINPAFEMQDDVYQIAFDRLDDFVRGLGGSKFHSSAWTPNFSRMLKSRPTLEDRRIPSDSLRDHCGACNRSGHPATWEVKFTGKPYNARTLEEDSDDDSEDDEDDEINVFYIGKFCMRNARTAHALGHWKYHLKEWIVDYLKDKGELSAAKIVQRDDWSTKRRRKEAERIVDEMEEEGEIKTLHRDFSREIKDAHYTQEYSGRDMSSP